MTRPEAESGLFAIRVHRSVEGDTQRTAGADCWYSLRVDTVMGEFGIKRCSERSNADGATEVGARSEMVSIDLLHLVSHTWYGELRRNTDGQPQNIVYRFPLLQCSALCTGDDGSSVARLVLVSKALEKRQRDEDDPAAAEGDSKSLCGIHVHSSVSATIHRNGRVVLTFSRFIEDAAPLAEMVWRYMAPHIRAAALPHHTATRPVERWMASPLKLTNFQAVLQRCEWGPSHASIRPKKITIRLRPLREMIVSDARLSCLRRTELYQGNEDSVGDDAVASVAPSVGWDDGMISTFSMFRYGSDEFASRFGGGVEGGVSGGSALMTASSVAPSKNAQRKPHYDTPIVEVLATGARHELSVLRLAVYRIAPSNSAIRSSLHPKPKDSSRLLQDTLRFDETVVGRVDVTLRSHGLWRVMSATSLSDVLWALNAVFDPLMQYDDACC